MPGGIAFRFEELPSWGYAGYKGGYFQMKDLRSIFGARRIVALTGILVVLYLSWVGPERFWIESSGTWILSPSIYATLLPSPGKAWLIRVLVYAPWTGLVLLAAPVVLLLGALGAAVVAFIKDSILLACVAMGLTGLVFGAYHLLQPLGFSLHYL